MYRLILFICFAPLLLSAQNQQDTISVFKKRVLENTEIDLLGSFYHQEGSHASVTGGIGTETLTDFAGNINVSIPLNDDDVFSIDATVSAYSSASSSNLNPFSGASSGDDDDDDDHHKTSNEPTTGTPWVAASGASANDVWFSGNLAYSHSSDDRNHIYNAHLNFAKEFDYTSFGAGIAYVRAFNRKNTELNLGANIYLDAWNPQYPTEIKTYINENGNLEADFFNNVDILDSSGQAIDKNSSYHWKPLNNNLVDNKSRKTYSFTISLSQILNKRAQFSLFSDITYQNGWLANPMQRVYFADIDNFYIGNASNIINYTNRQNTDVFQLADDIERLPSTRLKFPIGLRLNYFINEFFIIKTYYRYYTDDWGVVSNTFNIELPIKIGGKFTIYPNYRFYNQTAADYFAPYEQHLSNDQYYTSDYDLSKFSSNQIGLGIKYTDIFTKSHIWKFHLKNISFNYNYYQRNIDFHAHIVSIGAKIIFDKAK